MALSGVMSFKGCASIVRLKRLLPSAISCGCRFYWSSPGTYESRRVVVTGLGSMTSLGTDVQATWKALLAKESGIRRITDDMNEDDERFGDVYRSLPSRVAGRVDDAEFRRKRDEQISKTDLRSMSRVMAFSLLVTREALEDAKVGPEMRRRAGVAIGNSMPDFSYIGDSDKALKEAAAAAVSKSAKLSPYFVPKVLPNLNGGQVSLTFGLRGPLHCVSTACASGTHAIGDAFNLIKTGATDVMVAGAVDACISPLSVAGFCRARALTTKFNETPAVASRPFDKARDGFALAEGCSVLVLEERESALARGADVYAEVVGYGLSGDAHHITSGRDDGEGALDAMLAAARYLRNRHSSETFELWGFNAHATSTPKGDRAELLAISKFLQSGHLPENLALAPADIFVSSHKGNLGHLLGGAGSTESCFVALALKTGSVPATINLDQIDDSFEVDPRISVLTRNLERSKSLAKGSTTARKAIVKNSFGFGGTNATLIFAEHL